MRLLSWLGRKLLDIAAGLGAMLLVALAFGVVVAVLTVLFAGPSWAQWTLAAIAAVVMLAYVGANIRAEHRAGRERPGTPRATVPTPIDPVFTPRTRARSATDERWAAMTDDGLRAKGIENPASMRCIGFSRYCAMVARQRSTTVLPPAPTAGSAEEEPEAAEVMREHWTCEKCGDEVVISHLSTFCKRDGTIYDAVHWCCPKACELDDPVTRRAYLPCDLCPAGCAACLKSDLCECGAHPGYPARCDCATVAMPPCSNCEDGLVDPDNPTGAIR